MALQAMLQVLVPLSPLLLPLLARPRHPTKAL